MKVLIVLLACVALVSAFSKPFQFELRHGPPPPPPRDREARDAVWKTFVARQDNHDLKNNNTFNMRYIENDQFHSPGNPIFILLGGEWTIDVGYTQGGLMFDMARTHGGAMFYTEHRYYGESIPVEDFSTYNLRFLTIEQAMLDVAHFIVALKQTPKYYRCKVVVVGGSYSGIMAIWMRSKYRALVDAAWSSSAPILAKADFFEYAEVVAQDFSECSSIIDNGLKEVQRLFQSSAGIQKVSSDFKICHPFDVNSIRDTMFFYITIFYKFTSDAQLSTPESLKVVCNNLNNSNYASDYDKLAAYVTNSFDCLGTYEGWLGWYHLIGLSNGGQRRWMYQTCSQFGFFMTSTSPNQPFVGLPLDVYYMLCKDIFGPTMTREFINAGIAATNKRYGGLNPDVTRVISTHGTYDPWHPLGLKKDLNKDAPVIIIQNVSHIYDMGSIVPIDPPHLVDVKIRIQRTISEWLAL